MIEFGAGNCDIRCLEGGLGVEKPEVRVISPKIWELDSDFRDILGGLWSWSNVIGSERSRIVHVDVDGYPGARKTR